MTSIRFIHCADLHLDRPFQGLETVSPQMAARVRESTFRSFHRVVDAAIGNQVDFVVIAGDLFDGVNRSLRAQARFRDEMNRLNDKGIAVFAIHGNHDFLGGDWAPLEWPENVHVFGPEVEMLPFTRNGEVVAHLYGFSYDQRAVVESKVPFYKKTGDAPYHIGILHGQAEGSGADHAPYAPFTIRELLEKEFDYWALGHIHIRQCLNDDPTILYSGNIQGLSRKETGEKGCTLVDMDGKTTHLSFIPTADIEWQACEIPVSEIKDADKLLEICEQKLEALRKKETAVLAVVNFSGSGPLHTYLHDEENVEDLLSTLREGEEDRGNFVWLVACRVETIADWNRDELKRENHFIGDLLRLIDEEGVGEVLEHRRAKRFLPEPTEQERQEVLQEAENLLLTELLRGEERK